MILYLQCIHGYNGFNTEFYLMSKSAKLITKVENEKIRHPFRKSRND